MQKFDELVNKLLNEDSIPGGKADKSTIETIAKKHNVSVKHIEDQIKIGVNIEMEHTNDRDKAIEISMDHLYEFPNYYTRLVDMEKKAEKDLKNKKNVKESMVAGGTGSVFSDGTADIGAQGGKVPGNFDGPVKGDARNIYGTGKPKMQKRKFPETISKKKKKKKN